MVSVQRSAVSDSLEAVGTVRAAQTSQLASQLLANIVEIRGHEGMRVKQGEVLAVLDDAQAQAGLERARATLAAAEQDIQAAEAEYQLAAATLRRYQDLYEKKSVSPQEFDEVQARHKAAAARRELAQAGREQARAALAQAETVFQHTRIRAPFEGLVTEKRADLGTLATPGMILFVVEDTKRFRLEVTVDESEIQFVRMGQSIPVLIEALGAEELAGQVVQIIPAADPATRSFTIKVELSADKRLRSGLFGRAQFARGERQAMLVPATAVVRRGQLDGVYVLDPNNVASLRYITEGKTFGPQVEVLSGLAEGERVVADPGERDLEGKRVEAGRP
ncbi:MAG TPA: efflux RND transporter periplasmic adaptor subunit [Candidatus Xenobia bacterium]|nr:efflux RND transporter periplasmic adaptor subunit [Candidatus Xenobia bacterium]